ncbi:transglutaminase domain-containing protein [Altibacter sp. HG106]|uniref:transglutaminase domain-containing protein n=1 Tax=Altibacter sp. HG106 TaxID=3023937 RepID=UPI002350FF7A|nr:transglutaminase domain-containing protein [Altibacter sp. HG106]MDC7994076.1 transglutaminase domain-containing protein [Altibacter sp. HG106]
MLQAQDFERVDATIELYPSSFDSTTELAHFINRDFSSEAEKVRAIYTWIISNVAYDPDEYKKFNFNFKNYRERNVKEEKTRQQVIARTLQEGIAVCEGYAMLFEKLCEEVGISSYLVRGDTKTHFNDIGRSFNTNHMWNIAKIDGTYFHFDPTWGAGRYDGAFIFDPSYVYFQTPAEVFINSHFPELEEDQLLEPPVSFEAFSERPLLLQDRFDFSALETPTKGVLRLETFLGNIPFSIHTKAPETLAYRMNETYAEIPFEMREGRLQFEVPLSLGAQFLLIYMNEQPVLGYKIK